MKSAWIIQHRPAHGLGPEKSNELDKNTQQTRRDSVIDTEIMLKACIPLHFALADAAYSKRYPEGFSAILTG